MRERKRKAQKVAVRVSMRLGEPDQVCRSVVQISKNGTENWKEKVTPKTSQCELRLILVFS